MSQQSRKASGSTSSRRAVEASFTYSASFPQVLADIECSLLVSTYQAGQLVSIGVQNNELTFDFHRFDQAMGVSVMDDRVAVAAKGQIWFLDSHPELAPMIEPAGRYDGCYLSRSSAVTGGIQCHEIAWAVDRHEGADLWIVNTLFSCLAGLDPAYSFVPRWRPPFITELAGEDRCHLNGVAMRDGAPAFVTVMAQTNSAGGWRDSRITSGAILEVPSGAAITTGLAMPHSPRWHADQLWVLNSGMGHLQRVDPASGTRDVVAMLPGYARGLAIRDGLAFVGLSKIRETAIFGDAPIARYHDQLKCGLGVVDLATGMTVATMEFTSGLEEIFDVQVLPGSRCVSLGSAPGDGDEIWLVPGSGR